MIITHKWRRPDRRHRCHWSHHHHWRWLSHHLLRHCHRWHGHSGWRWWRRRLTGYRNWFGCRWFWRSFEGSLRFSGGCRHMRQFNASVRWFRTDFLLFLVRQETLDFVDLMNLFLQRDIGASCSRGRFDARRVSVPSDFVVFFLIFLADLFTDRSFLVTNTENIGTSFRELLQTRLYRRSRRKHGLLRQFV